MKKTMLSMIESCTDDAARRVEHIYMNCPLDDNEYIMLKVKYGNYARKWLNGIPVPSTVMKRAANFFRECDLPKMWYPLVDAIERNNPKQLKEAL